MEDFFFNLFIYYLWLCGVFVSVRGPPPVAASGGHSPSRCTGLPPSRPLPLRSTGSRRAGPAIVAHGPSHSAAHGILPDQGSNPCPLHRQADSQPLRHQGGPIMEDIKGDVEKEIGEKAKCILPPTFSAQRVIKTTESRIEF